MFIKMVFNLTITHPSFIEIVNEVESFELAFG